MMNRFVMADAAKCIGCKACEVACVRSHNGFSWPQTPQEFLPRIQVVSNQIGSLALTCRQCDDAPCARVCPVGALVIDKHSVQALPGKCIGCKSCVMACPFGAISLVVTHRPSVAGSVTKQVSVLKCDLCEGISPQPSCVAVCPTKALEFYPPGSKPQVQHQKVSLGSNPANETVSEKEIKAPLPRSARQPRKEPQKKDITIRKTSFDEIYNSFTSVQVAQQGDRCLACGDHSFCEWNCPLHNRIPHWVELAKEGRIIEAAELSNKSSTLPEVCGRVCPQDRLCERSCTLKRLGLDAVTVGNIERYITDTAFAMGWQPNYPAPVATGRRVAIVGAGPAGLGCADILNRNGVQAVVFESQDEIGGMLTFGIPAFKLDKSIIQRRRVLFSQAGIDFRLNTTVGKDIAFQELLDEYDAVFLGVGTYASTKAGLENEQAPGVYEALPYLVANTRHVMGLPEQPGMPYTSMRDKRVVVLGGGDTAMDCIRTALRQQAASVICAYRRDEANMPGSKKEVKNATEEGGEFLFNVQPLEILLSEHGEVRGLCCCPTEMGPPDAFGRRRPQMVTGREFCLETDAVIVAFGFSAHPLPWLTDYGVSLNKYGCIMTGDGRERLFGQTSHPKIFAGGDIVRGANLVVNAMADGRQAARSMITFFNQNLSNPGSFNAHGRTITVL